VIEQIKSNPDSRRLIISAWNVGEQKWHFHRAILMQFYVSRGTLSASSTSGRRMSFWEFHSTSHRMLC
jgi:thymidylate synthase